MGWGWGSDTAGWEAGVESQMAGVLRSRAAGQPCRRGRAKQKLGSKAQRAMCIWGTVLSSPAWSLTLP